MIIPPRALKCLKSPKNGQIKDFIKYAHISVEMRTHKKP